MCTELGIFRSNQGVNIFASTVPVTFFAGQCVDIFGPTFTLDRTRQGVDDFNRYFGGRDNLNATNIVVSNGLLDPWSSMSLLTSNDPTIKTIVMQGASHCTETNPTRYSDMPDVIAARLLIDTSIGQWLSGTQDDTTSTAATMTSASSIVGGVGGSGLVVVFVTVSVGLAHYASSHIAF